LESGFRKLKTRGHDSNLAATPAVALPPPWRQVFNLSVALENGFRKLKTRGHGSKLAATVQNSRAPP